MKLFTSVITACSPRPMTPFLRELQPRIGFSFPQTPILERFSS